MVGGATFQERELSCFASRTVLWRTMASERLPSTNGEQMQRLQRSAYLQACCASLDAELVAFHEHIFPTPSATAWRLSTFRHFKKLVRSSWPSVGVHPYGSFATGLFLPERSVLGLPPLSPLQGPSDPYERSDMDVVICGSSVPDISIQHLLAVLERQLSLSDFVRSSSVIPNARVPLVKFTTTPAFGGFAFDVSFNEQSGLRGTKHVRRLLKQAGEAEQRVPRLILLVKFWLRRKGLMGVPKGGMGGLLVVCMVVSFFQVRFSCAESRWDWS